MYVIVTLMLAAQAVDAHPEAPVADAPDLSAAPSSPAEQTSLDALVDELMEKAISPVRVALPPVVDDDAERAKVLQLRLERAFVDRGREELVTPAMVRRVLGDAAAASLEGAGEVALRALSADHVLLAEVVDAAGQVRLELRLLHVETGAVLHARGALLDASQLETTARATTVRKGVDLAVDQLADALARLPGERRYQRVAVAPLEAQGAAVSGSRVERFVQAQLGEGLRRRGYLVVERARLSSAMGQLALGAQLGEDSAPALGQMLDAQALVLGSVSEAGDTFVLTLRAVSTEGGAVLGAADALLPREGAITLASGAVETRSAGEAFFRSAVAPGWGQLYNRQSTKALAFGVATYGAALATVGLGVGAGVFSSLYANYTPDEGTSPLEAGQQARGLRTQANALLATTAISGGITALLWGAGAADALLDGLAYE